MLKYRARLRPISSGGGGSGGGGGGLRSERRRQSGAVRVALLLHTRILTLQQPHCTEALYFTKAND